MLSNHGNPKVQTPLNPDGPISLFRLQIQIALLLQVYLGIDIRVLETRALEDRFPIDLVLAPGSLPVGSLLQFVVGILSNHGSRGHGASGDELGGFAEDVDRGGSDAL